MEKTDGQFDVVRVLEYSVLGAMIKHPDRAYETLTLRDTFFTDQTLRKAFIAIRGIYEEGGADALSSVSLIRSKLCSTTDLGDVAAVGLIADAIDHAPETPGAIGRLIEEISSHGLRRAILDAGTELRTIAEKRMSADESAKAAMDVVNEAVRSSTHITSKSLADQMQAEIEIMERIDRGDYHETAGLSTGLKALDNIIGGCHDGEMLIVAARPSIGKSSLANRLAWSLAVEQGVPGLIVSAEMKSTEYVQRILSAKAQCDLHRARQRLLAPDERRRYIDAGKGLMDVEWYIEDSGGISTPKILATATRLHYEKGIRWVIVDYLQRIDHVQRARESSNAAIERTSNAMKDLALSLSIPVICLSQLNRDCEKRDNKRPRLSDLRDSGSLEQDADVVMMLYRDRVYWTPEKQEETKNKPEEVAEIIVAKQRNGPTGTARVGFNRSYASFHDLGIEEAMVAEFNEEGGDAYLEEDYTTLV